MQTQSHIQPHAKEAATVTVIGWETVSHLNFKSGTINNAGRKDRTKEVCYINVLCTTLVSIYNLEFFFSHYCLSSDPVSMLLGGS